MKKLLIVILLIPALVFGQLKNNEKMIDIRNEILKPLLNNTIGLSLIDPAKLTMSHSYSLSYYSIGGESVSQSLYLNTLNYQIADPLSLSIQWGIQSFPHNTFNSNHPAFNSGLFFSGAELNYRPTDNLFLKFQVSRYPYYNNSPYPYQSHQLNNWENPTLNQDN